MKLKKVIIMLLVLTITLLSFMNVKDKDTIIIYASTEQFRTDELQKQLNSKFPELSIRVMYMPTAKAAAKLVVEQEESDADIIVGLETSYMGKVSHILADIEGYSTIDYIDGLKPEDYDNKFVTWERFAGAFVVNTTILEKHNLEAPETYDDLLKPEYKGLIAMPDPKSSGTGYFFYKNLVNERGEEAALQYFKDLEVNIKQFTESGSGPIKLLNQGEIAVGLAMTFQAVSQINNGMPFEIIFPQEGSPYSLSSSALISGRENDEQVVRVFDFIINDFLKYDKEYFSPEAVYHNQLNRIEDYPQDINYADMTGIESIEEKERLLELWPF